MSALVATIEMLFTPLWSFEQFRYLCCNFAAHSHQQPDVVQVRSVQSQIQLLIPHMLV
jgi:hypothetical protein